MSKRIEEIRERAEAKFPSWSDCRYLLDRVERLEGALEEARSWMVRHGKHPMSCVGFMGNGQFCDCDLTEIIERSGEALAHTEQGEDDE